MNTLAYILFSYNQWFWDWVIIIFLYLFQVDSKEREKHQMINHVMEGKVVVSKMEEKLRVYTSLCPFTYQSICSEKYYNLCLTRLV